MVTSVRSQGDEGGSPIARLLLGENVLLLGQQLDPWLKLSRIPQ